MNPTVVLIEMLVFSALFTALVFAVARDKEAPGNIHNYPPDIQEAYFRTHPRVDTSYRSGKVILRKLIGILFFIIVLTVCAVIAGAETFLQGFLLAFGLMVWIGAYDTFFLDWVLFANMKCFRLPGTEHMDKAYRQKWFHLKGMLFPGLIFALIPAAVVGLIVMLIR